MVQAHLFSKLEDQRLLSDAIKLDKELYKKTLHKFKKSQTSDDHPFYMNQTAINYNIYRTAEEPWIAYGIHKNELLPEYEQINRIKKLYDDINITIQDNQIQWIVDMIRAQHTNNDDFLDNVSLAILERNIDHGIENNLGYHNLYSSSIFNTVENNNLPSAKKYYKIIDQLTRDELISNKQYTKYCDAILNKARNDSSYFQGLPSLDTAAGYYMFSDQSILVDGYRQGCNNVMYLIPFEPRTENVHYDIEKIKNKQKEISQVWDYYDGKYEGKASDFSRNAKLSITKAPFSVQEYSLGYDIKDYNEFIKQIKKDDLVHDYDKFDDNAINLLLSLSRTKKENIPNTMDFHATFNPMPDDITIYCGPNTCYSMQNENVNPIDWVYYTDYQTISTLGRMNYDTATPIEVLDKIALNWEFENYYRNTTLKQKPLYTPELLSELKQLGYKNAIVTITIAMDTDKTPVDNTTLDGYNHVFAVKDGTILDWGDWAIVPAIVMNAWVKKDSPQLINPHDISNIDKKTEHTINATDMIRNKIDKSNIITPHLNHMSGWTKKHTLSKNEVNNYKKQLLQQLNPHKLIKPLKYNNQNETKKLMERARPSVELLHIPTPMFNKQKVNKKPPWFKPPKIR